MVFTRRRRTRFITVKFIDDDDDGFKVSRQTMNDLNSYMLFSSPAKFLRAVAVLGYFIALTVHGQQQQQRRPEYSAQLSPFGSNSRFRIDLHSDRQTKTRNLSAGSGSSDSGNRQRPLHVPSAQWSKWSECNDTCTRTRYRACPRSTARNRKSRRKVTASRQHPLSDNDDLFYKMANGESRKRQQSVRNSFEQTCTESGIQYQMRACIDCVPASSPSYVTEQEQLKSAIDYDNEANSFIRNLVFSEWTRWSPCSEATCVQVRLRVCTMEAICGRRVLVQHRPCNCANDSGALGSVNRNMMSSDVDANDTALLGGNAPMSPASDLQRSPLENRVQLAIAAAASSASALHEDSVLEGSASTSVENMLRNEAALSGGRDTMRDGDINPNDLGGDSVGLSRSDNPTSWMFSPNGIGSFDLPVLQQQQQHRPVVVTAEVSAGDSSAVHNKLTDDRSNVSNYENLGTADRGQRQQVEDQRAYTSFANGYGNYTNITLVRFCSNDTPALLPEGSAYKI